jgi:hypothetical protein
MDWRAELRRRPWWVTALLGFCAFMTFVYVPYDMLKPLDRDEEVWFGFVLRGWAAKATEPLHWAIYAALGLGFWRMAAWVWPAAALYVAQIAIGMLVWCVRDERGPGVVAGLVAFAVFAALAWLLWRARPTPRAAGV